MSSASRQEIRDGGSGRVPRWTGVREFRPFLKKLALRKFKTYRGIAEKLCTSNDPDFLEDLIERRTRQIEHLLNDPDDGDPRMSLGRAVEELVLGDDVTLPSRDYGWDPSKP